MKRVRQVDKVTSDPKSISKTKNSPTTSTTETKPITSSTPVSKPAPRVRTPAPVSSTTNGNSNSESSGFATRKRSLNHQAKGKEYDEESDDDDDEEFGQVAIDMASSDEEDDEKADDGSSEGSDQDDFPVWEDNEKEDLASADGEKDEGDGEEEEDMDDDYMSGDSLDERDLEEEDRERVASNDNGGYKKKLLPEIDPVYDSDSSTEDVNNTVGNIPIEWYDDYPHIGYDLDGKRVLRPAKSDELEKFLATMDDPDNWRSVTDKVEGKEVVLNDEELDIIKRLQEGSITDAGYDPYE
ncbi:NUC169 domain-containing protein, partial [Endogone sp. FLAS-F59071]